jgi:hypothetical protein
MTWTPVATILLTNSWQFTEPVDGSIFRIKHIVVPVAFYKGLICQSFFGDSAIELFDIQSLYAKPEADIVEMRFPSGFVNRRIGVKRSELSN